MRERLAGLAATLALDGQKQRLLALMLAGRDDAQIAEATGMPLNEATVRVAALLDLVRSRLSAERPDATGDS